MAIHVKLVTRNIDRSGRATVYAQYTHAGKSKWWHTKVKVRPTAWDTGKERITASAGDDYKDLNARCQDVKNELEAIILAYFNQNRQAPTLAYVDAQYRPNSDAPEISEEGKDMFSYLSDYVSIKDISDGTKLATTNMSLMVARFAREHGVILTWDYFTVAELERLVNWMVGQGYANNTTINQISLLKTYLAYFAKRGLHDNRSYVDFTLPKLIREVSKDALILNWEEYRAILNAEVENGELAWARDAFCFSCCTGLRWSDCCRVEPSMVHRGVLYIKTQKTNQDLEIPLNADAKAILKRQGGTMLRNGKPVQYDWARPRMRAVFRLIATRNIQVVGTNEYGAEISYSLLQNEVITTKRRGRLTESKTRPLWKALTFHKGRSTFVCLCLEKAMPEYAIRSMTGHKDLDSFSVYINAQKAKQRCMASW